MQGLLASKRGGRVQLHGVRPVALQQRAAVRIEAHRGSEDVVNEFGYCYFSELAHKCETLYIVVRLWSESRSIIGA